MLFDAIPDTSGYMIAGYTVAFGVMAIYLASIFIRWRNLTQDLEMLENLQAEEKPKSAAPAKRSKPEAKKSKTSAKKKK